MSVNGELCATVSSDKNAKVFDVLNFGKIYLMEVALTHKVIGKKIHHYQVVIL